MKIHRLKLQNFRQHARTEISFDDGITGIIGPNGSGKTTILEAIAWALYGNQAVRGTRDSIRHMGAGPRAQVEVELEFELGSHLYRVSRGLTTANVYLDGADAPIANSITGANELLQRRLGMTRTEFFNTYFTGQKELSVMAAMGPTERGQFLSRVLGYERLRTAQEILREKRRDIGSRIAGLRSGMPDLATIERDVTEAQTRLSECVSASNAAGTRHATALAEVKKATPAWETMQKQREQWQRLLADVTIAEREAETLTKELDRLRLELGEMAAAKDELQTLQAQMTPLAAYRQEILQLDDVYRRQGRRQTLVDNERILREEIVQLRERLERLEQAAVAEEQVTVALERERAELERVQQELDAQRTAWARDKQEAETKLAELRRQFAEAKDQRERLVEAGPEGICPTCNRPLGDNYAKVVEQLDEQLATLKIDGQYYRDRGEQLQRTPQAIVALEEQRRTRAAEVVKFEKQLAQIQAQVQQRAAVAKEIAHKEERRAGTIKQIEDIPDTYDAKRHAFVRAELERLAPLETRAARLSASVDRLPAATEKLATLTTDREAAVQRRDALKAQGATVHFSEHEYTATRDVYERAVAESRASELAVVEAQGAVRAAQQTLDTAMERQQEYARISEQLDALNRDRLLHDELDRTYTDLRTDLNFQLRPELSELASEFLSVLTDDRYSQLELDDQYNVIILDSGVPKPVISGGEEDLANLVLRLAISQMIAERAGQVLSLLVLDEVFGSLDVSRRDNVIDLLRRLQDRFEQVILITHIEQVRDGVDHLVTVSFDPETASSVVETGRAVSDARAETGEIAEAIF